MTLTMKATNRLTLILSKKKLNTLNSNKISLRKNRNIKCSTKKTTNKTAMKVYSPYQNHKSRISNKKFTLPNKIHFTTNPLLNFIHLETT